jgi:tetratricopeptide (TPR) repeat protein
VPFVALVFLVLLPPQLVDRTKEATAPPLAQQEITTEKRADIYMARKMYREAVETYQEAIKAEPQAARLYNKIGIAYHQQRHFNEAKRSYNRALQLDKTFSQSLNNLGTVYHAERRLRKATRTYRKALKIDPNSASFHSNLGTTLFNRGKLKQATEEFLVALNLDPKVFEHRGRSGTILQERSVENRAKLHFFMARAYASAGIFDRALLNLRRAFEDGYRKPRQVLQDPAFEPMLDMPELQALLGVGPQQAAR